MDAKSFFPGMGDGLYSLGEGTIQDPRSKNWHMDGKPIQPIMESVSINPMKVINVPKHFTNCRTYIVPSGIGDIAWLYAKLINLGEPLVIAVAGQTKHPVHSAIAQRAFPFLDLLDGIAYKTLAMVSSEQVYWATVAMNFTNCRMPASPGYLACNRWLEKGQRLDDFLPNLKLTRHFKMKRPKWATEEANLFIDGDESVFAIYPSSADYFGDQNVALAGWMKIIKRMIELNPKSRCILIGAPWDLTMLVPLYDAMCAIGYSDKVTMIHDRHFAVSLEILRRCEFLIGAVSGLTIVSEYQKIPTVHIYPKHLYENDHLMGTWESPYMVGQKLSLSLKAGDAAEDNLLAMERDFAPLKVKV